MEKRLINILGLLSQEKYITATDMARILGVSSKTVRNDIKQLNDVLHKSGAEVETKQRYGYKLIVKEPELFRSLLVPAGDEVANTSEKRVNYLIEHFLTGREYTRLEELCETLYVCKKTLTADVKKVEKIFEKYNIHLERRPYYGMRISGNEIQIRACLAEYVERKKYIRGQNEETAEFGMPELTECLARCLDEYRYAITDVGIQSLALHMYIAITRIREKKYVPCEIDYGDLIQREDRELAKVCAKRIGELEGIEFPEPEIEYLALHLAGKKAGNGADNIVISGEIHELVHEMLEEIYRVLRIDLRNDLELIISLGKHLGPLLVRLKFGLHLKNPLLKEIKDKFCMPYIMSCLAVNVLIRSYGCYVDPDEIGYIAIAFALSLERCSSRAQKKSVLLVCSSGIGTVHLISYRIKELFGDYIDKIHSCELRNIGRMDFSDIDYIFTMVPIDVPVPVPVCEVQYFMKDEELKTVRELLREGKGINLLEYFPPELFFPYLSFEEKEEVIRFLVNKISEVKRIPDGFAESVLEREKLAATCFGNEVSMPHPCQAMTEEMFVAVGILDKPLRWDEENTVKIILLLAVSENPEADKKEFFRILSEFMLNKELVEDVAKKQTYPSLIRRLTEISIQAE